MRRHWITVVWACALACGGQREPQPLRVETDDDDSLSAPQGTTEAWSSESGDDESTGGVRLDLGDATGGELGCRKIDFLFVIDNSASMADEQQRLIDGFPGFIAGVQETIREFDYHVMVVTTDVAEGMSYDPCENMLGTGRVRDAEGRDCGLLDDFLHGKRYIDASHEDLEGAFACIADVGTNGRGDEKVVWALADAIVEHAGPGLCNEGFRRDDAILVVTIISDEEDSPFDGPPVGDHDDNSPGGPAAWREGLVATKNGDDEAVVVLALVGDSDLPNAACEPYDAGSGKGAEPAQRLRKLAESLPYGSWTSVCQDDYAEYFNQAIADIGSACSGFVPPG